VVVAAICACEPAARRVLALLKFQDMIERAPSRPQ